MSTVRKIVEAERREVQAIYDATPRSQTAERVRLARQLKDLEREVMQLDVTRAPVHAEPHDFLQHGGTYEVPNRKEGYS